MSQIRSLTQRLHDAEATIRGLQEGKGERATQQKRSAAQATPLVPGHDPAAQPENRIPVSSLLPVSEPYLAVDLNEAESTNLDIDSFWDRDDHFTPQLPVATPLLPASPPRIHILAAQAESAAVRGQSRERLSGVRGDAGRSTMASDLSVDANGEVSRERQVHS